MYATHGTDDDLILAIILSVVSVLWLIIVTFVARKLELILTLYEIAATIIMDQPFVLVGSFLVSFSLSFLILLYHLQFPLPPTLDLLSLRSWLCSDGAPLPHHSLCQMGESKD